jgi:hypothetical protein
MSEVLKISGTVNNPDYEISILNIKNDKWKFAPAPFKIELAK